MTKKINFCEKAETLFVIHGKSLKELGLLFGVSSRTLQNWKTDGNWEIKRAEHLCIAHSSYKEAHALVNKILREIADEEASGKKVEIERYNSLHKLSDTLVKLQKSEMEQAAEQPKEKVSKEEIYNDIKKILFS